MVSKRPVILLAHGAEGNSHSEFMKKWKELLAEATDAVEVVTFDYPFLEPGKKKSSPPKPEKLVAFHERKMRAAMAKHPGHPLILCGKSYGSRVSGLIAGKVGNPAKAMIALTYPLEGKDGSIREDILLKLRRPVIFIQGTEDKLGPLDKLANVREKMKVTNRLHVVPGGNHKLEVSSAKLKDMDTTQKQLEQAAAQKAAKFVKKYTK